MTPRSSAMPLLVAWTMGLMVFAASADAAKPDAEKRARRAFEKAEAHFNAGLFAEALAEYQDGYAQLPLPGFLINIAQCQRRLGDLVQARATYNKFVLVAPDSPYVPEVRNLIAELDRLIETPTETRPAGEPQALAPPPTTSPEKTPGPLPAAATARPPNQLLEAELPPPPPAATGSRWWMWAGLGTVAVVGAAAAVYWLRPAGTNTVHDGSLGTLRR
jgi:tetratricopeptide (TPR) repeat protein